MIYLPNHFMHWYHWQHAGDVAKIKWNKHIGFYSSTPQQRTFYEMVDCYHLRFLSALEMTEPMEKRVYEALGYRDLSISELKYMFSEYHREYGRIANVTVQTALNRLMRQGKVTRTLHSRGWFQWYVYARVD